MTTPAPIDGATRAAVDAFLNRLAPRFAVREAILFGRRARDARPDSDADMAIILHGGPKLFMQAKLDMADIAFEAILETGIRVDSPDMGSGSTGTIPLVQSRTAAPYRTCGDQGVANPDSLTEKAARAALPATGANQESVRTQSGFIAAFGLQLVKRDRVERPLGHALNRCHEIRLVAGYTGDLVDIDLATWVIDQAGHFVGAMRNSVEAKT